MAANLDSVKIKNKSVNNTCSQFGNINSLIVKVCDKWIGMKSSINKGNFWFCCVKFIEWDLAETHNKTSNYFKKNNANSLKFLVFVVSFEHRWLINVYANEWCKIIIISWMNLFKTNKKSSRESRERIRENHLKYFKLKGFCLFSVIGVELKGPLTIKRIAGEFFCL